MPGQTTLSKQLRKRAGIELIIASLIVIGITLITLVADIDAFEWLFEFTRAHEEWDLDEVVLFIFYLGVIGSIYTFRRLQDIKRLNQQISELAFFDEVTQLPNRALATDRLNILLHNYQQSGKKLAVAFVDFDNFKVINDTYGHSLGDSLLKQVGNRLRQCVGVNDTVGRLGGDEFLLLITYAEQADLEVVATKLREVQQRPYLLDFNEVKVTFSIGVALYPKDATCQTELLKAADSAMYHTKKLGKGDITFYDHQIREQLTQRYYIETGLKTAISQRELHVQYQPQASLKTEQLTGYEALLRWQKDGQFINPAEFITIAEETGQIEQIGFWVLEQALTEMQPVLTHGQTLSVNLSPRQFHQENLVPLISNLLNKLGFPAEQLELEITESAIISNFDRAISLISELKKLGITIAVDDFGTGYSSLIRLRDLGADRLKIDKHFINRLNHSDKDEQLVKYIIMLAQNMDLNVVAEGVETPAQLAKLRELGCDAIQGYLYARPMPIAELLKNKQGDLLYPLANAKQG
ncbi:EAL domain-containing protein [Thalassotalea euphylliae]|uniref:EAL domain-containing protein n=1 Tax=Thalassotalea euphylliae TaxID=1655234 RepID=A0A3E0TVS0_9GAMM|nr:EAL domain-containing protein [Thalassotalea euphylliae]REL28453.1 EAL domain-containing protein [Thalassotalea euphylliae]